MNGTIAPSSFALASAGFGTARGRRDFLKSATKVVGASILGTMAIDVAKPATALGSGYYRCVYCTAPACSSGCCTSSGFCKSACAPTGYYWYACIKSGSGSYCTELRYRCSTCTQPSGCDCIKYLGTGCSWCTHCCDAPC